MQIMMLRAETGTQLIIDVEGDDEEARKVGLRLASAIMSTDNLDLNFCRFEQSPHSDKPGLISSEIEISSAESTLYRSSGIDKAELKLLAYLHISVSGFGRLFPVAPDSVAKDLKYDPISFSRAVSYLREHDLLGVDVTIATSPGNPLKRTSLDSIHLTRQGEDYVRALEAHSNSPGRLTPEIVDKLWNESRVFAELAGKVFYESRGKVENPRCQDGDPFSPQA
jgi:hypothetical protein